MNKKINNLHVLIAVSALTFTACNDETPQPDPGLGDGSNTRYIVAAHPNSAEPGTADYLLTVDDITSGSISTTGNGVEQDGTYRYYMTSQNKFFSLLYGQGNPGAVTSYVLNADGELMQTADFVTETVQVFAPMNDELALIRVPRSGNENAVFIRIDATNPSIKANKEVNIVKLAGNGERAHFTWATQFGEKLLAPYMSIKGCCDDVFGTQYPDSTWVAVFSYPDLNLETVIKDNRTSYLGAYFKNGLFVDENGDAYGFSGASVTVQQKIVNKKPSAIVRIKAGTTEFDQSYFFNFEEKTNGYKINAARYVGNGKFLVQTYGSAGTTTGVKFTVVDVYEQTVEWVSGVPNNVSSTTINNYGAVSDDKTKAYVGLTLESGSSYVYEFDINSNSAKQGLQVQGGKITGIHKLNY